MKTLLVSAVLLGGSLFASACIGRQPEGGQERQTGSSWTTWLLPIAFIAILYFVLMRPQQRKAKFRREMLRQLEIGDEVLLTSGIYGRVVRFDEPTVFVEISDTVQIKVTREAIAERITYREGPDENADEK